MTLSPPLELKWWTNCGCNANSCETQKKLVSSPIVLVQEEGEGEDADRQDDGGDFAEEEEEEEEEGDGPGESSPLLEQGIIKTVDPPNFP